MICQQTSQRVCKKCLSLFNLCSIFFQYALRIVSSCSNSWQYYNNNMSTLVTVIPSSIFGILKQVISYRIRKSRIGILCGSLFYIEQSIELLPAIVSLRIQCHCNNNYDNVESNYCHILHLSVPIKIIPSSFIMRCYG